LRLYGLPVPQDMEGTALACSFADSFGEIDSSAANTDLAAPFTTLIAK